ncbi:unnamed protein product [Cuscuta epithymum]|uniref:Uncharacterized protein n=1 Tax=Cuscuta epithymum TaxID=186058 RepID=A0AAV0CUE1_9ASTE|nr:unnamed protein product [Cuscuta epithymum]
MYLFVSVSPDTTRKLAYSDTFVVTLSDIMSSSNTKVSPFSHKTHQAHIATLFIEYSSYSTNGPDCRVKYFKDFSALPSSFLHRLGAFLLSTNPNSSIDCRISWFCSVRLHLLNQRVPLDLSSCVFFVKF